MMEDICVVEFQLWNILSYHLFNHNWKNWLIPMLDDLCIHRNTNKKVSPYACLQEIQAMSLIVMVMPKVQQPMAAMIHSYVIHNGDCVKYKLRLTVDFISHSLVCCHLATLCIYTSLGLCLLRSKACIYQFSWRLVIWLESCPVGLKFVNLVTYRAHDDLNIVRSIDCWLMGMRGLVSQDHNFSFTRSYVTCFCIALNFTCGCVVLSQRCSGDTRF